jgi:hypothetical protein
MLWGMPSRMAKKTEELELNGTQHLVCADISLLGETLIAYRETQKLHM